MSEDKRTLTTSAREREYLAELVEQRVQRDEQEAESVDGRERRMVLADIELGQALFERLTAEPRKRSSTNTHEGTGEAAS